MKNATLPLSFGGALATTLFAVGLTQLAGRFDPVVFKSQQAPSIQVGWEYPPRPPTMPKDPKPPADPFPFDGENKLA